MPTGDPVCPDCGGYNCRDDLGRSCRQRMMQQHFIGTPVPIQYFDPIPGTRRYYPGPFWNPPVFHEPTGIHPDFITIKPKESWQCMGCKRHYAPHVDHCDCAVITNYPNTTYGDNHTFQN